MYIYIYIYCSWQLFYRRNAAQYTHNRNLSNDFYSRVLGSRKMFVSFNDNVFFP